MTESFIQKELQYFGCMSKRCDPLYDEAFAANGKEALKSLIAAYESTGESLPIPKVVYSA